MPIRLSPQLKSSHFHIHANPCGALAFPMGARMKWLNDSKSVHISKPLVNHPSNSMLNSHGCSEASCLLHRRLSRLEVKASSMNRPEWFEAFFEGNGVENLVARLLSASSSKSFGGFEELPSTPWVSCYLRWAIERLT